MKIKSNIEHSKPKNMGEKRIELYLSMFDKISKQEINPLDLSNFIFLEEVQENQFYKTYEIMDARINDTFLAKILAVKSSPQIISGISMFLHNTSHLYHPCLLKYIGYSTLKVNNELNPTIITEYTNQDSLKDFLMQENTHSNKDFNDTFKLIMIYGIASAMSYLHLHEIVHQNLEPSNVLFDNFFLPKLDNYEKFIIQNDKEKQIQKEKTQKEETQKETKEQIQEKDGKFKVKVPEEEKKEDTIKMQEDDNDEKFKVKVPEEEKKEDIIKMQEEDDDEKFKVKSQEENEVKGKGMEKEFTTKMSEKDEKNSSHYIAPETLEKSELIKASNVYSFGVIAKEIMAFPSAQIPSSWQDLIERCLSREPQKRPTFDEILALIKNDGCFMTEKVNKNDFYNFVRYIDESTDKTGIQADKFINSQSDTFKYEKKNEKQKFIDLCRYLKLGLIGEGQFGQVFKVKEISTGKIFAAKIINKKVSSKYKEDDDALNLFREIKIMSALNHPSIIKFYGYSPVDFFGSPYPTMIIEFAQNGTLDDIIKLEKSGRSPKKWDKTRKLINIYGIASGMLYLHSNDITHRDLKPANIMMDDDLLPKISDFGFSKAVDLQNFTKEQLSLQMQSKSVFNAKGTPEYMSPEALDHVYTKSNDVFAFSILVYELLSLSEPYPYKYYFQILKKVAIEGDRPDMTKIPTEFHNLLTKCWDADQNKRPTFEEIVKDLKENKNYITEAINENEYYDYIYHIDECKKSFDLNKSIQFKDLADSISKNNREENSESTDDDSDDDDSDDEDSDDSPNDENKKEIQSEVDPKKLFLDGKKLIEGSIDFQKDIELGVKYLEESIDNNCIDSLIYYCTILIEGKIIPKNIEKAKSYLKNKINHDNDAVLLLYGKVLKHEKKFKKAKKMIRKSAKKGNKEAMYEYGKMLFCGKGCTENEDKAMKYFNLSMMNGFERSKQFLMIYQRFNEDKSFYHIENADKLFFIKQVIKNDFSYDYFNPKKESIFERLDFLLRGKDNILWKKVVINSKKLNEFYSKDNKFGILNILEVTKCFEDVSLYVLYPSELFDLIVQKFINAKSKIKIHVTFSDSIDKIADDTFKSIPIVLENEVPYSVLEIGNNAFNGCHFLTQITIPSSVKSIGNSSFEKCYSLKKITMSDSVEYIGEKAFSECVSLESITIPASIKSIENSTFNCCESLKEIMIPTSIESICDLSFNGCELLKIIIPTSVKTIGESAFRGCSSLTEITIPSSVTKIGDNSFADCKSLSKIVILCSLSSIGNGTFYGCSSLTTIEIPSSVKSIGNSLFEKCSSLKNLKIPDSVEYIGEKAFSECVSLESITIPASIKSIENSTFNCCESLKEIIIPTSIESICDLSFNGCKSLSKIIIPTSVKTIGKLAFRGCSSLTEITIPPSITRIEIESFSRCYSLVHVEIPPSVTSIGNYAFCECSSLNNVIIPSSVTSIGKSSFGKCHSLTEIVIHSKKISIENQVIRGEKNIKRAIMSQANL